MTSAQTGAALPAELLRLEQALATAERDARELVAGLTETLGAWRADKGFWSVAECLDHLATANRVYLAAMRPLAERALRGWSAPAWSRTTGTDRWVVREISRTPSQTPPQVEGTPDDPATDGAAS